MAVANAHSPILCRGFLMALRSLTTSALRAELARRERGADKLRKKHAKLARALAQLEGELAGLGAIIIHGKRRGRPPGSKNRRRGPGPQRGRRSPGPPRGSASTGRASTRKMGRPPGRKNLRNKQSLAAALASGVRPGTVVSPAQAVSIVRARGYKTTAKKFGMAVAHTLAD